MGWSGHLTLQGGACAGGAIQAFLHCAVDGKLTKTAGQKHIIQYKQSPIDDATRD